MKKANRTLTLEDLQLIIDKTLSMYGYFEALCRLIDSNSSFHHPMEEI